MADTQSPDRDLTQKIEYQDKEGNKYAETHGDPTDNLTVETVAEQQGVPQPNREGTTPHPHNPKLTEQEQERRGVDEDGNPQDAPQEPPKPLTTTTAEPATTKQADQPPNKSTGKTGDK